MYLQETSLFSEKTFSAAPFLCGNGKFEGRLLCGNSNFEKFSIRCKLSAIILVIADNLHKIPTGKLSIFSLQSRKFRTFGNLSTVWGRITKRGVNFPVETAPKHLARRGEGRWERCSVARCALRFSMVTNVQKFFNFDF